MRLRKYLEQKGWWNEKEDVAWKKQSRVDVLKAFSQAEKRKKPAISELFTDVYDVMPKHLQEQQREMLAMVEKYPDQYPLSVHVKSADKK